MTNRILNIEAIRGMVAGYLECAVWASHDWRPVDKGADNPVPLNDTFSADDFTKAARAHAESDCRKFLHAALELNESDPFDGAEYETIGHDFWLTRNQHGAGFWDGDYPRFGDALTKLCESFVECWAYPCGNNRYIGIEGF